MRRPVPDPYRPAGFAVRGPTDAAGVRRETRARPPIPAHPVAGSARAQAGVGMIDVLIALVVLSIGLLGLAGLQATGLRYNHGAYLRTQATLLAYGMADRMRANIAGVTAGSYNSLLTSGTPPAASTNCTTSVCSSVQMADYDAAQWEADVQALLPSGKGVVTPDNTGDYTITVSWTGPGGNSTSFATMFHP